MRYHDAIRPCRFRLIGLFCLLVVGATPALAKKVIFVFDKSGSMAGRLEGEPKIDIAKRILGLSLAQDFSNYDTVGLVALPYQGSCNVGTVVDPARGARGRVSADASALSPVGATPLAKAIDHAASIAESEGGAWTIVILSDGEETCGGDPVARAGYWRSRGVSLVFPVIGFAVKGSAKKQLTALAKAGGAQYYPADDANSLRRAIRSATRTRPQRPRKVQQHGRRSTFKALQRSRQNALSTIANAARVHMGAGRMDGEWSLSLAMAGGVSHSGYQYPIGGTMSLRFLFWLSSQGHFALELGNRTSACMSIPMEEDESDLVPSHGEEAGEGSDGDGETYYFGWESLGFARLWLGPIAPAFFVGYREQMMPSEVAGLSYGPGLSIGTSQNKHAYFVLTGRYDMGVQEGVNIVAEGGVGMAQLGLEFTYYTESHTDLSYAVLLNLGVRAPW